MMQDHAVSPWLFPGWILAPLCVDFSTLGTGRAEPSASGSFPVPGPSIHPSPGARGALQHLQLLLPSRLAWKEELEEDTGRSERSQLLKLGKWGKKEQRDSRTWHGSRGHLSVSRNGFPS